ncbi:hypothetical protein MWU65_04010 [Cellulophaga sp. F20128]|uniref:hypothetical protein n=1 Tax=Cellulophaga sp. F20128 TaxID=2926413 RepID=UPI001FF16E08|nr:hypothetical protein [Cellulophaga sp. F20128]MCK0156330.1 hypothetical protein [Cellulophaga sp. F20128]
MKKDLKQGQEDFQFVKEKNQKTRNYLMQKDKTTIIAFIIVLSIIVILLIGLWISAIEI